MISFNTSSEVNEKSIIHLFFIFIVITTILFFGMTLLILTPKINNTFEDFNERTNKISAKVLAAQFHQYIFNRELALKDIASHPLVTNTTLLASGDDPVFLDFVTSSKLLGEDPQLSIIDASGELLFSESTTSQKNNYQWALPIIDAKQNLDPQLQITSTTPPHISIAVPIVYGQRNQGIIIAKIDMSPENLFQKDHIFEENIGVAYEKNGQRIESDLSNIAQAHIETIEIERYKLNFSLINDQSPITKYKRALTQSFVLTIILGSLFIFGLLFIIGRKILVKPYEDLALSKLSIASAIQGISFVDPEGRYTMLNNAYAGAAGYTPEELTGEPWSKTVYPEDLPALNEAYETMLKDGKVSAEARGLKKDGSIFYKHVTMISRFDNKGSFIGHDCFMQDITEKKIAEEKIRKQQQELQLIFDHVRVRVWYKDDKNRILRLNKQAAESMGGSVEEFEGKDTYDLFPAMAKKYHEDDLAVIQSKKPLLNIIEEYTPINSLQGWVSTDKIPYTDPVSQESFIFVCSQDITELKRAEEFQSKLNEQLLNTNEELEQFAYIASHDLKAPLRGISQLAGWIQQDCADALPESSQNHLDLMVNRVDRMGKLLDDLLTYSRVNRIDLTQEHVDLKAVFSDLLDLHVHPFGFRYTLNMPEGHIVIARKPLEIVIRNLLDNAVKHHHQGKGHITIEYKDSSDAHLIQVSDDGPGIDPKLHEKAFKMFQTLQPRDKVEGSGMGLAVIKKILGRYKGSIEIDSDGKNGTTFNIIWPHSHSEYEI